MGVERRTRNHSEIRLMWTRMAGGVLADRANTLATRLEIPFIVLNLLEASRRKCLNHGIEVGFPAGVEGCVFIVVRVSHKSLGSGNKNEIQPIAQSCFKKFRNLPQPVGFQRPTTTILGRERVPGQHSVQVLGLEHNLIDGDTSCFERVVSNLSCGSPVVEFEHASQPLSGVDFAS